MDADYTHFSRNDDETAKSARNAAAARRFQAELRSVTNAACNYTKRPEVTPDDPSATRRSDPPDTGGKKVK